MVSTLVQIKENIHYIETQITLESKLKLDFRG